MIRQATVLRVVRLLLLLGAVITVATILRGCERLTIPEQDRSMDPTYPGGTTVYVEVLSPEAPLDRGMDVVYEQEVDGTRYARFGRVQGVPGDDVGERDGRLTVNGEPVGPAPMPGKAMGRVPEGALLILAINPAETRYQDSRALSFIPRARVRGRIKTSGW
jgi:hypothetical protein